MADETKNPSNKTSEDDEDPSTYPVYAARDHDKQFNPVTYLEECYEIIEKEEVMQYLLSFLPGMVNNLPTTIDDLLDLGAGPTTYIPIAFRNRVKNIYTSDYAEVNRKTLQNWIENKGSFDWSNVCKWISYVEGSVEQPAMMEARARRKMRAILEVNVHKEPVVQDVYYKSPTCNQIPEQFDVVATVFCLEYASETLEEYSRAVKSAVSLIKPGGFLLQGGVLNSDEYYTGRRRFRCHRLTRDDVLQCLKADEHLSSSESDIYILPISESKLTLDPKEKVREIICNRLQNECFEIVDEFKSESTFLRKLIPQNIGTGVLSDLVFEKIGSQDVVDKTQFENNYFGAILYLAFQLETFDNLEDIGKSNVLQIGLGGGSINVLFEGQFPEARLTTVEIDPTMKYIAIKWFTTKEDDKHKIIVADGVNFVKENDKKFDLILLDACYNDQTSSLSCPVAPFLDPSVIKAISDSLNPNGTLAINSYYTIIPTPKEHEELISKFKPYFRQCMVQNISKNFVLGCSKQDLPEITEEYLRIRLVWNEISYTFADMENTSGFESDAGSTTEEVVSDSVTRSVSYSNLDAEKVLEGFGTFGAYQMLVYGIVNTGFFLCACESRVFSLILDKPEFTCNKPEESNATSDQCEYFDYEANSTIKCSNFSYKEGKYAYVTSEFDLVCDNAYYVEYSMSLYLLGAMLFTPISTQLADLYGRRIIYLVLMWLTVLANIGCAFAPSHTVFMGFIFIAGIGATGVETIGYILMLEAVAPSFRSYTSLVSSVIWVAGYMIVGIVHVYIKFWRWELLLLTAPFILTFSYYWFVPESIYWLITHNKILEVERWIEKSEKFNCKKLNLEEYKNLVSPTSDEGDSEQDHHKRTFIDLFSNGPILFQLICHSFIMIVMYFTYWALSIFSTELYENKMTGYFLSNIIEIVSAGTVLLFIYFGRRTVTSVSLLAQAVVMCVAVFYPGQNLISMILFLLVKGFNSFTFVSESLLLAEMAPTSTRNMFCGFIAFIGEVGSVIAPYFNRLKTIHEVAPAIAVASFSLVAGLLALCSPETMNVSMPEDIDGFDPGPVYSWIFKRPRRNRVSNVEVNDNEDNSTQLFANTSEEETRSYNG